MSAIPMEDKEVYIFLKSISYKTLPKSKIKLLTAAIDIEFLRIIRVVKLKKDFNYCIFEI